MPPAGTDCAADPGCDRFKGRVQVLDAVETSSGSPSVVAGPQDRRRHNMLSVVEKVLGVKIVTPCEPNATLHPDQQQVVRHGEST
jgi:hypothetical protein